MARFLPNRSDTKWLNQQIERSRKVFQGASETVTVVRYVEDPLCTVTTTSTLSMHLLRSEDLAKLYDFQLHSNATTLEGFDKWYHDNVKRLSCIEKGEILRQCYNANRHRVDLINNRYYHGVVNDSFVIACEQTVDCKYRLFEERISTKDTIHFRGSIYFPCGATPHRTWSFYSIQISESEHIWHSAVQAKSGVNRLTLSEIIDVFVNHWFPQSLRDCVRIRYGHLRLDRVTSGVCLSPKLCDCVGFTGNVKHYNKYSFGIGNAKSVTYACQGGFSRFKSGVWKLSHLCTFFIVNFFYNDKSLLKAILPPGTFAQLEEESKVFTHSWRY